MNYRKQSNKENPFEGLDEGQSFRMYVYLTSVANPSISPMEVYKRYGYTLDWRDIPSPIEQIEIAREIANEQDVEDKLGEEYSTEDSEINKRNAVANDSYAAFADVISPGALILATNEDISKAKAYAKDRADCILNLDGYRVIRVYGERGEYVVLKILTSYVDLLKTGIYFADVQRVDLYVNKGLVVCKVKIEVDYDRMLEVKLVETERLPENVKRQDWGIYDALRFVNFTDQDPSTFEPPKAL